MIIHRWVASDIHKSEKIQDEIRQFFESHGVANVVICEENMGCPHEEGEDFLTGEDCPFCPYWQGKQGSNQGEGD